MRFVSGPVWGMAIGLVGLVGIGFAILTQWSRHMRYERRRREAEAQRQQVQQLINESRRR